MARVACHLPLWITNFSAPCLYDQAAELTVVIINTPIKPNGCGRWFLCGEVITRLPDEDYLEERIYSLGYCGGHYLDASHYNYIIVPCCSILLADDPEKVVILKTRTPTKVVQSLSYIMEDDLANNGSQSPPLFGGHQS